MGAIAVIGSVNIDMVNHVKQYPLPGETIHSERTVYNYGGKGANQAVAAARSGASVMMAGAVGSDAFGGELRSALQQEGIDTQSVARKEGNSGIAFITVDASGQNQIILSAGANGQVGFDETEHIWASAAQIGIILLQNEIAWETNERVLREAKERGIHVLFNPAPALDIPAEALACIGTLVLNESEAAHIAGVAVTSREQAETAARKLAARGVQEVIVTLGSEGSLYLSGEELIVTPAFPVKPVDTTAAGDTFIGAYAARRLDGHRPAEALQYASAAAALTVTRSGAQSSIPRREEVERFMNGVEY